MQSIAARKQCKALQQESNVKHCSKKAMQSISARKQCKALQQESNAKHCTDVAVQRLHTPAPPQKKTKIIPYLYTLKK